MNNKLGLTGVSLLFVLATLAACGGGGGDVTTGPPASGTVEFIATFPTAPFRTDPGDGASDDDVWWVEQKAGTTRATVVNIGRDGGTGLRLHTEPGDNNVAGSGGLERNDLSLPQNFTDGYEGQEAWWAHSILFPDDFDIPSTQTTWNWAAVFGWHHTGATGQGNFTVFVYPNDAISAGRPGINFRGYGGPQDQGEFNAYVAPIVKNVWYDFVYHIKWSSGQDGFFEAWVNGERKLSHHGPTLYAGQGVYLKLSNYHTAFGQSNSVIHDRVIRGTTWQAVSLTPLEGVQP